MTSKEESLHQDEGINEVLRMTHDLNIEKAGGEQPHQEQEPVKSDTFVGAHGSSNREMAKEESELDIDLADPERVLQMLETVDLSEEDTEILLQEAYKMNRQLKEILKHQESSSCPPDIQRQKTKSRLRERQSAIVPSHSESRSDSRTFSASRPLPPISQTTDIYTLKLKRSQTNIPVTNRHSSTNVERSKSSKGPTRNVSTLLMSPICVSNGQYSDIISFNILIRDKD